MSRDRKEPVTVEELCRWLEEFDDDLPVGGSDMFGDFVHISRDWLKGVEKNGKDWINLFDISFWEEQAYGENL